MAERLYNNYSVPDHLAGDERDEARKPRLSAARQSAPTLEQLELEQYYSDPSKTPDHLDGSLDSAPGDKVRMGKKRENIKKRAGDAVTEKARQIGDDGNPAAGLELVDAAMQDAGEQPSIKPREEFDILAPGGEFLAPTTMPASWTSRTDKDMQWMMDNPALMKTLLEMGTTPAEIQQVVDFDYARQAALQILEAKALAGQAAGTPMGEQARRAANGAIRSLNPAMRAVVEAMAVEINQEAIDYKRSQFYEPPNRVSNYEEGPSNPVEASVETGGDFLSRYIWNASTNIDGLMKYLPQEAQDWIINNPITSFTDEGALRVGAGGALDAAFGVVDLFQQGVLMNVNEIQKMARGDEFNTAYWLGDPRARREAWNDVQKGNITQETKQELVQKYGAKDVNMVLQMVEWGRQGEDVFAKTIEVYGDDPNAGDILLLFTDTNSSSLRAQELGNLVKDVEYADSGDFMNLLAGNEYRGDWFDAFKPMGNLGFGLLADPFWATSKPIKAIRGMRYSIGNITSAQAGELDNLIKLTNVEDAVKTADRLEAAGLMTYDVTTGNAIPLSPSVTKMFGKRKVKHAFNAVGANLKRVDETKDLTERANARRVLYSTWKKYFPEEMLDEMSANKVYSADDAMYWYHDNSLVGQVLGGYGVYGPPSALIPKAGTKEAAKLKGAAVATGDAQPLRQAAIWENDPMAMVQLGQKATAAPLFPNIGLGTIATKRLAGISKLGTLNFVTAPQREALNALYGGDEAMAAANADDVTAVMQVLNEFPELVAAIDSDWMTVIRGGEDAGTVVSPQTLETAYAYMRTQKATTGKDMPLLAAESTGWGKLFNYVRSKRKNSEGRSATKTTNSGAKVPRSRWQFPGRTLYVNGEDVLQGAPLNNTFGRRRKDMIIAPTAKELFSADYWRDTLWAGTARRVDRWSRAAARYPHNTLLRLDGKNGRAVYEFARAWGLSTAHANVLREVWRTANPAQRKQMAGSMAQAAAYSRGVPYLFKNPEDSQKFLTSLRGGDTESSMYSATVRKTDAVDESYNPSVYEGPNGTTTSALSGWQTTDTFQMPNIGAMERVMAHQSLMYALLGNTPAWESVVNWWSLGTLAGPRYQLRAGLEDFAFYSLTNTWGWIGRYVRGQAQDEALRLARGGKPAVVKQIVGPKAGKESKWSDGFGNRMGAEAWRTSRLRQYMRPLERSEADEAIADLNMGNRQTLVNLTNKVKSRQALTMIRDNPQVDSLLKALRLDKKLNKKDEQTLRWLDEMIETDSGLFRFDEVSEGGDFISNGTMPMTTAEKRIPGLRQGIVTKRGEVIVDQIANLQDAAVSKQVFEVWGRQLFGRLSSDGEVIQVGLRNLDGWASGDAAKQGRILDNLETEFNAMPEGYRNQFTMVETLGQREFLRRYMDDTLNLFSRRDGSVNDDLLKMLWNKKEKRYSEFNANFENLSRIGWTKKGDYDVSQLPRTLYDKYGVLRVQVAENLSVTQRVYSMMGNSLSRLSREPIYMSNYLLARKQLEGWEDSMYQQMRAMGMGEDQARKVAGQRAADLGTERAMNLTLSYTDNPNTRSMLAWQVRNVSRYWRAQEDLFRRLGRTIRYKPMAIWRGALTYELLGSSGFMWENDNGEKYFMYPGADVVLKTLTALGSRFNGGAYVTDLPTTFTGKLNLLTPSADPNAMFPTVTPGLPTVAWEVSKFLTRFAPSAKVALDNVEPVVFGEYGAPEGLTGVVPYNWRRLLELGATISMSDTADARTGVVADSVIVSLRALAAADRIPNNVMNNSRETEEFFKEVEQTSYWVAAARILFGFVEPSRANYEAGVPSRFARSLGISDFRPEFIALMNEYDNDWSTAMVKWIGLFPNLAPYTVGTSEAGTRGGLVQYGRAVPSPEAVEFLRGNENFLQEYPTALPYLAPEGQSTVEAYGEMTQLNLTKRKKLGPLMQEIAFSEAARQVSSLRIQEREGEKGLLERLESGDITAEEYDVGLKAGKEAVEQEIDNIKDDYPELQDYLNRTVELPQPNAAEDAVDQLRGSVNDMLNNGVYISAGVGSLNKLDVARKALDQYDQTVVELSDLAAQADELGVTETRRRERKIIDTFLEIVDINFGYPKGAQTSSIQDFANTYMVPVLEAVYKEER